MRRCDDGRVEGGADRGRRRAHAGLGRFDDAHALLAEVRATYRDLGLHYQLVAQMGTDATVSALGGDWVAAERSYRKGCDELQRVGETGALCTFYAWLADVLCDQGRFEEAERLTRESEEMGDPDDLINEVTWRHPRARALARRGELSTAETTRARGVGDRGTRRLAHRPGDLADGPRRGVASGRSHGGGSASGVRGLVGLRAEGQRADGGAGAGELVREMR